MGGGFRPSRRDLGSDGRVPIGTGVTWNVCVGGEFLSNTARPKTTPKDHRAAEEILKPVKKELCKLKGRKIPELIRGMKNRNRGISTFHSVYIIFQGTYSGVLRAPGLIWKVARTVIGRFAKPRPPDR